MRISRDGKPEIRLREDQIEKVLRLAKARDFRHYVVFALMGQRGLRIGSVIGMENTVRYFRKRDQQWMVKSYSLPGLKKEDVKDDHLVVHAKRVGVKRAYINKTLLGELQGYANTLKPGQKLVEMSVQEANDLCKEYAKEAGITDWDRAHPHRWRHYFGTYWARRTGRDPWKVKSLLMQTDIRSTMKYVEDLSPEEESELFDELSSDKGENLKADKEPSGV